MRGKKPLDAIAAEGQKLPLPSIVVVEIKRPMRKDATEDKNPIQQCLDYVKRIRAKGVLTATGRPIPPTHEPPAFCYIIARPYRQNDRAMRDLKPAADA